MNPAAVGQLIHVYSPHSAQALYAAAAISSVAAVASVFLRCKYTKSAHNLQDGWLFQTAAAAAPVPTYLLLLVVPFDPDLARTILDDRVVVALAGLYGLIETLKDIRKTASHARQR